MRRKPTLSPISPGHRLPEGEARGRHRQLAGVAVLLAAPAPVAARLLGADPALLHQRHLHAAPGEIVGGAGADDAAADHHHVGGRRKGCGGFDRDAAARASKSPCCGENRLYEGQRDAGLVAMTAFRAVRHLCRRALCGTGYGRRLARRQARSHCRSPQHLPILPKPGERAAREARPDRHSHPSRVAEERPHHQCGARRSRASVAESLPAAREEASERGLYQWLFGADRRREAGSDADGLHRGHA